MKGKKCMLDWLFRAGEPVSVISFCCNDMVNPSNWFLLLLRTRIYIYTFVNIFIIAWQIPAMEWMSVIEMFVITLRGQGGDWGVRESDEPETYRLIISSPPGLVRIKGISTCVVMFYPHPVPVVVPHFYLFVYPFDQSNVFRDSFSSGRWTEWRARMRRIISITSQ